MVFSVHLEQKHCWIVVRVQDTSAWRVPHPKVFSVQGARKVLFSAFRQIFSNNGVHVTLRLRALRVQNTAQCWGQTETTRSPMQSWIMSVALTEVCFTTLHPSLNTHFKGKCRRCRALYAFFFLRHVQLKPVCSAAVTMQMAELHVWLGKHTGRHLFRPVQSAGWATSMWTMFQYLGWLLESDKTTLTVRGPWCWTLNHITKSAQTLTAKLFIIRCTKIMEQMSKFTHWWRYPVAWKLPYTHVPQSAGLTGCHVMGGTQTSWTFRHAIFTCH